MKIEGPNKTGGTKGASKTGGAKSTGSTAFSGMLSGPDEVEGHKPVASTGPVGPIDALLALQEGASGEESQRRAKRRGVMLLDELDQLKMGLLTGGVPESTLQHLTNLVNSQRDEVMDPQLRAVLDEIDLRVQVELAKFSRK